MSDLEQVINQCKAVSHLAAALKEIHDDYAILLGEEKQPIPIGINTVGQRTAFYIETIMDWLENIDSLTEEDEWLNPILEQARKSFPQL